MSEQQTSREPSEVDRATPVIGASIDFCPSTGEMTIRFVGGPCHGLPPWSSELAGLAAGARSITVDLTSIDLADPDRTVEMLRNVVESEFHGARVTFELEPASGSETNGRTPV